MFNAVLEAAEWILKEAGISVVLHTAPSILIHTVDELNLPVALDKLEAQSRF